MDFTLLDSHYSKEDGYYYLLLRESSDTRINLTVYAATDLGSPNMDRPLSRPVPCGLATANALITQAYDMTGRSLPNGVYEYDFPKLLGQYRSPVHPQIVIRLFDLLIGAALPPSDA